MSYFYNLLLRQNLQKDTGGGGEPDYSKIKGSLIKEYALNDNVLSAGYPVYISSFDETGVINYASRRGFAREIVQTKSLVLDQLGSASVLSFPVMSGNTSGLCYMSQYDYINYLGSIIGSKVQGSLITGYGSTSIITGSVITSGLYVCISTGSTVEKISYSNFFTAIDGNNFGTVTTGLTGRTPSYLFATITENSGKTIERISLNEFRSEFAKAIPVATSAMLSGISDVFVRLGSNFYSVSKSDFNTWLNS